MHPVPVEFTYTVRGKGIITYNCNWSAGGGGVWGGGGGGDEGGINLPPRPPPPRPKKEKVQQSFLNQSLDPPKSKIPGSAPGKI